MPVFQVRYPRGNWLVPAKDFEDAMKQVHDRIKDSMRARELPTTTVKRGKTAKVRSREE